MNEAEKPRAYGAEERRQSQDNMGDGRKIVDLMLEIRDMPERQIRIDLDCLVRSTAIFHTNYVELKGFLAFCEDDPRNQDLWHMHSIRKQDQMATETWRLLHNFVAAAFSLVEHTRIIYRRLNADGEFPEYQPRVDEAFRSSSLAQFVQDLRNYVLHTGGGKLYFHGPIDIRTGRSDTRLGLRTSDLLDWSGWKALAKRFLKESEKYIDIAAVAGDYHARVRDFHMWFGERQREIRGVELDRLREKETELFVLELNVRLCEIESGSPPAGTGETGLFIGLFDYSDYRELEALSPTSDERVDMAVAKLREHFPVPELLETRIRQAYSSATFFPSA